MQSPFTISLQWRSSAEQQQKLQKLYNKTKIIDEIVECLMNNI
jgi:hypothetical protein